MEHRAGVVGREGLVLLIPVLTPGLFPQKMVKFNPGLSQILSKVFLSKNMQFKFTNTVEPLLRDTVVITQNVTLCST